MSPGNLTVDALQLLGMSAQDFGMVYFLKWIYRYAQGMDYNRNKQFCFGAIMLFLSFLTYAASFEIGLSSQLPSLLQALSHDVC